MARSLRAMAGDDSGPAVVSVSPPKRRRPSWVLAGAALVVLAALIGAWVFTSVSSSASVMVAAHDLEAGEPITAGDLRVVELRGALETLRAVQPDQQGLIVGLAPRAAIPAGTVLNRGLFVDREELIPAGKVVVGAALAPGELAAPSLRVGDNVDMVAVADSSPGADPATAAVAVVLGPASVWSISGSADASSTTAKVWVSLLVDEALQTAVAQAAADERLRVTLGGS